MKPHKGIPFNATDAAANLNGTKTRHLIRVSDAVYRKALFGYIAHSECHEDTTITKQQYIADYLNSHAPYKPGDVVYQKEKITCNALGGAIFEDSVPVQIPYKGLPDHYWHIDHIDRSERGFVPRTQMPMKYARCWLQIASCTAVQVDGVWMWEIVYIKTEKPIV